MQVEPKVSKEFYARFEDAYRVPLLEDARKAHSHGLLICASCNWAWLSIDTAKVENTLSRLIVVCRNDYDCVRRQEMRMAGK